MLELELELKTETGLNSDTQSESGSESELKQESKIDILEEMNKMQTQYYKTHSKNSFFKKSQKIDCAKELCKTLDLNEMIAKTIYVIPETNKIYMDYPIFKLYANTDNFDAIIQHIINTCRYLVTYHKSLEVFINLETFSVSAAERYKGLIKKYCDNCLTENTDFAILLTKLHILNTPSVIEMIVKIIKPVVDQSVIGKVAFYKKEESPTIINNLKNVNNINI